MGKLIRFVMVVGAFLMAAVGNAAIVDVPHNLTNSVGCGSCHSYSLWWQYSPSADPDQTADGMCQTCHGIGGVAPYKAPHNSLSMGKAAGLWGTHCVDCHDPHLQPQLGWRSSATDKDELYLVQGTIGETSTPVDGTTTFQYTLNAGKTIPSHWVSPATWSNKNSAGRGLILVDDTATANNTFSVVMATASTIKVKGEVTSTSTGHSFGLIYGQLVKKTINTPDGQARTVKFFDPNISNNVGGFTDPSTTPQGVCQVCHISTKYWRSNGQNADPATGFHNPTIVCTVCHLTNTGFKPSGGPHTFLGETNACVTCHTSGDILAVHKNNCQNCHTTPPALANPADKPLVAQIGQGDCQFCHGANAHDSEIAHNHRQTVTSCADCHSIAPQAAIDTLHKQDCGTCHGYTGTKLDSTTVANAITTGKGAYGTDVNCQTCHTVGHDTTTAHNHRQTVASCAACHAIATQAAIDTLHKQDCTTCHAYTGTKLDPATVANAIATGKGVNGTDVNCQTCHTVGHDTTTDHNHRKGASSSCVGCHHFVTQRQIDNYHLDDCTTCHGYTGTKLNAVTVANAITTGKGVNGTDVNCQTCHTGAVSSGHHASAKAVNNECVFCHPTVDHSPMVKDSTTPACTGCHTGTAGTATGVPVNPADPKVHSSCRTCHTFDADKRGILVNFTNSKGVNGSGQLSDGGTIGSSDGGGVCVGCHTGASQTFHHLNSHVAIGECEQCHIDPRGSTGYNEYQPGDNGGTNLYPTQLACRTCHVRFVGGALTVNKYARTNYADLSTPWTTTTQHTIPGVSQGQINNYGICFSCHGAGTATKVTVFHARPDKHSTTWTLGSKNWRRHDAPAPQMAFYAAGRSSSGIGTFNSFSDSYALSGGTGLPANDHPTPSTVQDALRAEYMAAVNSYVHRDGDTPWHPYKSGLTSSDYISIPASSLNNNSSGSVVVLPAVIKQTMAGGTIALTSSGYSVYKNAGTAAITVARVRGATGTASIHYATTTTGTATAGTYYTPVSGDLTWGDGDMAPQTFSIPIIDNSALSYNKTVGLQISNPSAGITLGISTAMLTILSNEISVYFQSAYGYAYEPSGVNYHSIGVVRQGSSSGPVSVHFATTSGGTAAPGTDYTPVDQIVTWADGESQVQYIDIPIINNEVYGGSKTINMTLTNATGNGVTLSTPSTGVVTILDDENPIAFSASNYTVNENVGTVTITVSRMSSGGVMSVNYATSDGTAQAGTEYTAKSGTLYWQNSDQTPKTFTVPITDNLVHGGNKTINLTLSSVINTDVPYQTKVHGILGSPSTAVLTIIDNE